MVWSCTNDAHGYNNEEIDCLEITETSRDRGERPKKTWTETVRNDMNLTNNCSSWTEQKRKIHVADPCIGIKA